MNTSTIIFSLLFIMFFACNNSSKTDSNNLKTDITLGLKTDKNLHKVKSNEDVIFYNMFSPLDIDKMIDNSTSYYNSTCINPLGNIIKYTNSHKVAINIGVYGSDLSYLSIFDQTQQALSYLSAIKHLTNKLGLPDNLVDFTVSSAQQNTNQIDSLIIITRRAYFDVDSILKATDRENYSLLILFGGWVESMHVALSMYNEPNSKLASKIITQKYSLSSLITMAHNCQDDMVLSEYLLLMKKMNEAFKIPESQLTAENVIIDTVNKRITIKDSSSININPDDFSELKTIVTQIRNHIIK